MCCEGIPLESLTLQDIRNIRRQLLYASCPPHCIRATRPAKAGVGGVVVAGGDKASPPPEHAVEPHIESSGNDRGSVLGSECHRGVD